MDSLILLNDQQIQDLFNELESDIPNSIHAHNYLNCVIRWKKMGSPIECKVMSPGGDYSDCTFMLQALFGTFMSYTAYSNSAEGRSRLREALKTTQLVDWDRPFLISCVPEPIASILEEDIKTKLDSRIMSNPGLVYWMNREEAAQIPLSELADDVYVDRLKIEESDEINQVWPHREEGSERHIAQMIELQGGLGLYSKDNNKLLSWGLYWFYGGMGVVQTDAQHFRKGYGSRIVERLTRYIAKEAGTDVHLNIVEDNVASVRMYEKLGFKYCWTSRWINPIEPPWKDPLVKIADEKIPQLLEMLKQELPSSIHSYSFLECLSDWKKRKPFLDIAIMAPNGDFSDATYVSTITFGKMTMVSAYSSSDAGQKRLEEALVNTKKISWKGLFLITCLPPETAQTLKNVLTKTMDPHHPQQGCYYSYDQVFWMPSHQALTVQEPKLPDDVYLDSLKEEHVELMDENYPHRFQGSDKMMSLMIELNPTVGLFRKSDGALLSWGMVSFYGGLGVVQTREEHRRKGYAKIVVARLTKIMGRAGRDVHLNVLVNNLPSIRCFESVGYEKLYISCWVFPLWATLKTPLDP